MKAQHRNTGLDLLRFVAVILVMIHHTYFAYDANDPVFMKMVHVLARGGWVGVDLFFVLSGYLVSGLLFEEYKRSGRVNGLRFLLRRGFKIYPIFYVLLFASIAIISAMHQPFPWRDALGEAVFLQNYVGHLWPHTWSLAVEEHFYIMLAILVWILARRGWMQQIPAIFFVVMLLCTALRISTLWTAPQYSGIKCLYPSHLRLDSLFWGVAISYWSHFSNLRERLEKIDSKVFILVGLLLLSPAFIYAVQVYRWVSIAGVILFYLGSSLLVLTATRLSSAGNPLIRLLAYLGSISYALYLCHMPVNVWVTKFVQQLVGYHSPAFYLLIYYGGTLLLGFALSKWVEKPFLALRDRLVPSRVSAL